MITLPQNGTLVACKEATTSDAAPTTLGQLLQLINRKNGTAEGMLHSTAVTFLKFLKCTADEVMIDTLCTRKESFISWLKEGKYKPASVKSYRNYLNRLLHRAEQAGWVRPTISVSPEWQVIADLMPRASAKQIVHFAHRLGRTPATLSDEDLRSWRMERAASGVPCRVLKSSVHGFARQSPVQVWHRSFPS